MRKTESKLLVKDIKKYIKETKNESASQARNFLKGAGILDKNGHIAKPYRATR